MTEPIAKVRSRWQFPLWVFLAVPAVCALAMVLWPMLRSNWPMPGDRWKLESLWCSSPTRHEFWPPVGRWDSWGDDLVKLARVSGPCPEHQRHFGQSWWVTPDDAIHDQSNSHYDAGGDTLPLPIGARLRLPTLLKALPPSDPLAGPINRVLVAFPLRGVWVVRQYRDDAVPREIIDLAKAIGAAGFIPETPKDVTLDRGDQP